jgi:hypothetical protein
MCQCLAEGQGICLDDLFADLRSYILNIWIETMKLRSSAVDVSGAARRFSVHSRG